MMKSNFDLTGKIALVTGAGQGLGKEFAYSFARAGADVYIMARNVERAEATAQEIRENTGAKVYVHYIDVTDEEKVKEAVEYVKATTGHLDILVNNAAVGRGAAKLQDTTLEEWNGTMNTILNGTFLCMKHFGKMMLEQAAEDKKNLPEGKVFRPKYNIINLASMGGKVGLKNCCLGAYDVSKAAVEGLTRCMAVEWAPLGIRVNSICPGYIMTDINKAFCADPINAGFFEKSLEHIPVQEWGDPREMGDIAVFIASEAASYINGANIVADGGYTIC